VRARRHKPRPSFSTSCEPVPDSTFALRIATATVDDAAGIAAVRNAAAGHLTQVYGTGSWSGSISERGVLRGINTSRVLIASAGDEGEIIGTLRLAARKPWAIDPAYFAAAERPLYLVDMAVAPHAQRRGIGRQLLQAAVRTAEGWKMQAIRLDAYDHAAGAGPFYAKCGFTEVGRNTYRTTPLVYYQLLLEESP
jgi:GNAT superfamily N-acetyltransferase